MAEQKYTASNGYLFRFLFKPNAKGFNVYCLNPPDYRGRSKSALITHLFADGRICFTGRISTERFASTTAMAWAERTVRYIEKGIPFED